MTEQEVLHKIEQIKSLEIQGNTNIAKTVVATLLDYAKSTKVTHFPEFVNKVRYYGHALANARDNEPLAVNAVAFITANIAQFPDQSAVRQEMTDKATSFFKYIDESYAIIRENAFNLLKEKKTFMTHCHSALVRDSLIKLNEHSPITVINTEARPRYQGRITATKLAEAGVKVMHVVDSGAASILLDPRYPKPEAVLVGSDGIGINGDIINKVGTYNLALAAKEAGIPFFVVTQSMKIDRRLNGEQLLNIEQRDQAEVWKEAPKGVEILNPAFDLVPAIYITGGYITEKGLVTDWKEYFS